MHIRLRFVAMTALAMLMLAAPARAQNDWTVLAGAMDAQGARPAVSAAFGHVPGIAGFEIEYLSTVGAGNDTRSRAGGIVANAIVHPYTRDNLQFFGVFGLGVWGQTFADHGGTGALGAKDLGGGVKIRISEHLRVRVDYRLFLLGEMEDGSRQPEPQHPQRLAVGLNLHF